MAARYCQPTPPAASPAASPEATNGTDVDATVTEFSIAVNRTTFAVGETYTFTVTNGGEMPHEFDVEPAGAARAPLDVEGAPAAIPEVAPGASETLTVTFSEPGNYQLACHFGQHFQNGMALNVVVEA